MLFYMELKYIKFMHIHPYFPTLSCVFTQYNAVEKAVARKTALMKVPKLVLTGPSPDRNMGASGVNSTKLSPIPTSPPVPTIQITFASNEDEHAVAKSARGKGGKKAALSSTSFRYPKPSEYTDDFPDVGSSFFGGHAFPSKSPSSLRRRRCSDLGPRRRSFSDSIAPEENCDEGGLSDGNDQKGFSSSGGFADAGEEAAFLSSPGLSPPPVSGGPIVFRRALSEEPPDHKVYMD